MDVQQSRKRKGAGATSIPTVVATGSGAGRGNTSAKPPSSSRSRTPRSSATDATTGTGTRAAASSSSSSKPGATQVTRRVNAGASRNSPIPIPALSSSVTTTVNSMKERFLNVFTLPEYKNGISNSALKEMFGEADYISLAPVINELIGQSRLTMSKINTSNINNSTGSSSHNGATTELYYQLVSNEIAAKFYGLDVAARLVYQVIERAGNLGIWTKDIRIQTNIQQQALNKIFKLLESRQLIKPVKSVVAKSKKLYMIYNLTPSKELTGGIWYSDLEFDHEFINELRIFLLQCIKRMNNGNGITLQQIIDKIHMAQISRVELSSSDVMQLIQTLIYDFMVEEITTSTLSNGTDDTRYIAARKVTPLCEFNWWEVLDNDFHYRNIRFEDSITLSAQELHYHT
jgi:DNA-directed RNA polymerase III subunit RPC6